MEGKSLAVAVALVGTVIVGSGVALLVGVRPPEGPPRPRPQAAPAPTGSEIKYSATLYRALVEQDAKALGVVAPTVAEMAAPFPYSDERPEDARLRPGGVFRTAHLAISLIVRREQGAVEGQSFRADHLVMRIENLTGHHLAYRVSTEVADPARCEAKGVIAHDAIALRPHETILRTECLFQRTGTVKLARVEAMEIPALSYAYVSRLMPGLVLYDTRTAAGHTIPSGVVCPQTFSWRDIRDGAARGEITWRDIMDFYGRHNCDEYTFFPGYHHRIDAAAPLPARPAP